MKESFYNVFVEYKDKVLGYNTLYNTLIVIDGHVYPILLKGLQNISSFESTCGNVFRLLKDKKFIISDVVDEISDAKAILYKTNHDNTKYRITINPTLNCNFRCWYCYETHMAGTKMTVKTMDHVIRFIKQKIDEDVSLEHLCLDWFGGEPFLYFKDIIQPIILEAKTYAEKNNVEFESSFTTNGYLLTNEILDFCVQNSAKSFQITLDGHKERHNQVRFTRPGANTYDKIVQNIKLAVIKGCNVSVRLNISADTNADISAILDSFKKLDNEQRKRVRFSICEVWQDRGKVKEEIEKIITLIRSDGFISNIYESCPHGIRNTCYADKENEAVINYDGKVFKCTARNFIEENKEGQLMDNGHIQWNTNHKKREMASVFNYPHCLKCQIMPICNASCSQQQLEHPDSFCIYDFDSMKKKNFMRKVILEKFYYSDEGKSLI